MPIRLAALIVALTAMLQPSGNVLYEAAAGSTPGQQGWIYLMDPSSSSGNQAVEELTPEATILDTMASQSDKAGYFASIQRSPLSYKHPKLPVLDRSSGYSVRFDVRLDDESHRGDRAGFGVIALSQDLKGVELELWRDQVWVQADAPLFTHGEGAPFDTTAAIMAYELRIHGDRYTVLADDAELLAGPLRDYSAFGPPYTSPSFLFFGDDTTSAAARVEIARVEVNPL